MFNISSVFFLQGVTVRKACELSIHFALCAADYITELERSSFVLGTLGSILDSDVWHPK
jgi:hypothetical protein